MKQIKTVLLAAACTLGTFSAIIYTSCKKDACKGVLCNNKGTCSNGTCNCPTGFSGKHCELSTIAFKNNTYTPVTIAVKGNTYIIAMDSTLMITDTAGIAKKVTASTSGKSPSGGVIGLVVNWSFSDTFPTNGAILVRNIDVKAENPANDKEQIYYLAVVNNNDSLTVTQVTIQNNYTGERVDMNVGKNETYGIGYFVANGNTTLSATNYNPSTFVFKELAYERIYSLPNTANQYHIFVVK